eukprot:UN13684
MSQVIHLVWVGVVVGIYLVLWIVKCVKFGAKDSEKTEKMMKVEQKSIEMGGTRTATFTSGSTAPIAKQPTFVDEEDDALPITKNITWEIISRNYKFFYDFVCVRF